MKGGEHEKRRVADDDRRRGEEEQRMRTGEEESRRGEEEQWIWEKWRDG